MPIVSGKSRIPYMEVLIPQALGKDGFKDISMLSRDEVGNRGEDTEGGLAVFWGRGLCALEEGG
jgi:hypothetical protein